MKHELPRDDLKFIADSNPELWKELRNAHIFLTGGTGFFGKWLIESFCSIQDKLKLNAKLTVLVRNPKKFRELFSHLSDRTDIYLTEGDVRFFSLPDTSFTHIIHGATSASASMNLNDPLEMFSTILDGTKRTLELAQISGATKFLLASSGAVYGVQPHDLKRVKETYHGAPFPNADNASYGEGKRAAECLSSIYGRKFKFDVTIARGFAFVGPQLPLDGTFAIGNFIRDGLNRTKIKVNGDGTPYRSYLYAADLAIWLWTILLSGKPTAAYNVGSDEEISIADLANKIGSICGIDVQISEQKKVGAFPQRYVPDVTEAKEQLRLRIFTNLDQAIEKTIRWNSQL